MEYRNVKGSRVPALGLGTWDLRGNEGERTVAAALDMGYRHVDTAQAYDNEEAVGAGIRTSGIDRDEVFLVTKIWPDGLGREDAPKRCEESLRRLGTDYVDLLLVHWPNEAIPLGETLDAFAALEAAGKTRHIGVSNFTTRLLREAVEGHGADLLCNQVEYHPYLSQEKVLEAVRRYGMMLTAYSPIARGKVLDEPAIRDIAERHGKSPAQIALRWLLDQEAVAAIPRTANEKHLRANFEIFDFSLKPEDRAAIDGLRGDGRMIEVEGYAPDWDPA